MATVSAAAAPASATTAPPPLTAGQEWRVNWMMVVAAMLGISFGSIPAATLGLFMDPLESAFGWSRTQLSAGMMVFALVTLPFTPFAGALVDKIGARRCVIPGLILSGLAFAAFSLMTGAIFQWFLIWVVYSFTALLIRSMMWNSAISNAFSASRGLAIALVLSGFAVSQTFGPLLANWLIADYGWRTAYIAIGIGWAGLPLVLVFFFFHNRLERRARKSGSGEPTLAKAIPGGLSLGEAIRNPAVLRIGLAIFLASLTGAAIAIHIVPVLVSSGVTRTTAAGLAALVGVASVAGKLLTGWLVDRITSSFLPFTVFALPALGYFLLWQAGSSIPLLALGIICMGYGSGGSLQMGTYLTTRYAGMRNFGKIFGLISSAMGIAAGIGPVASGMIYDTTGSYGLALLIAIPAALIAGIAVFGLGPYPDFPAHEPASD